MALNTHDVATSFDATFAKDGWQRLVYALGDEIAIRDKFFEFLH